MLGLAASPGLTPIRSHVDQDIILAPRRDRKFDELDREISEAVGLLVDQAFIGRTVR
jgi:hypothetical protein